MNVKKSEVNVGVHGGSIPINFFLNLLKVFHVLSRDGWLDNCCLLIYIHGLYPH